MPSRQEASKYIINNLCIPFTLDKDLWAGEKCTGLIYLGWHHCAAKLRLASSVHPKPRVYLWGRKQNKKLWGSKHKGSCHMWSSSKSLCKGESQYGKNLSLKSLTFFFIKISIKYLFRNIDYNSENQKQSKCPTINDWFKKKAFPCFHIWAIFHIWWKPFIVSYFLFWTISGMNMLEYH